MAVTEEDLWALAGVLVSSINQKSNICILERGQVVVIAAFLRRLAAQNQEAVRGYEESLRLCREAIEREGGKL